MVDFLNVEVVGIFLDKLDGEKVSEKIVGKIIIIFNIKQYSDRHPQKQIPFPRLIVTTLTQFGGSMREENTEVFPII